MRLTAKVYQFHDLPNNYNHLIIGLIHESLLESIFCLFLFLCFIRLYVCLKWFRVAVGVSLAMKILFCDFPTSMFYKINNMTFQFVASESCVDAIVDLSGASLASRFSFIE